MKGNLFYYLFSVVRIFLYPFALIYGALVWLRNRLYDSGFFTSIQFSVPVITVGNLSTGGTGKTPHIEYLVRLLQYQYRVATMSRGYKRHTQGFLLANAASNALRIGDEPMQYHLKFPELVVCVAEERMTGIPTLLQKRPDVDVILLDDAFQHRSVKAGFSILVTDYSAPFYKDFVLPFGSLREGRKAYQRASVIIVSKCPLGITLVEAKAIEANINPLPTQKVFFTGIDYGMPYNFATNEIIDVTGKNIILVCGIAKPAPMVDFLKQHAADIHTLTYKDHHYFVSADLEEIKAAYTNWGVENKMIVTTEKDAARLQLHQAKLTDMGLDIVVLPITVSVLLGQGPDFDASVLQYIEQSIIENSMDNFQ